MTPVSRRAFLAASAAAVASPAIGAPVPSGEIETIIVGAGAAGIGAARKLMAAGRRIAVIEAANRIGGRCVTDTAVFGVPFDLGAHWIYLPDINPLAKLAARTGLDIYPAPAGQRVRIGRRYARESELEDFLDAQVRSNRAIGEAAQKTDINCAQALPRNLADWRPALEFMLGAYAYGKDLSEISAVDFAKAMPRDSAAFCRQGFGALLAKHAEGIPVQLSTPALKIDTYGRTRVEVQTPKGTMSARYVIVTVSTDVLAAGKIRFEPELPERQLDAAARLKLGSHDHIALEFERNPLILQRDEVVIEKSDGKRTAALLANVSGTSLAVVDVGGSFGRELAVKSDMVMVDFAIEWLAKLYGADIRKAVKRTHATRWSADPWIMGGVASASPGGQGARRVLSEVQRDRVFFAGEALHETLWGTVGGAWETGERAAETVLRKLGVLRDPEPPARERPPVRRR
jgi:monoamine oxidase